MATNLHLDDALIERARKAGRHRTKKEAVTAALEAYVRHRKSLRILDLEGTVQYEPGWDPRTLRPRVPVPRSSKQAAADRVAE